MSTATDPSTGVWIVVTTINPPTKAVEAFSRVAKKYGYKFLVVGDKKTPKGWSAPGAIFLSLEQQMDEFGDLATSIPQNHYARKNFGYLYAMRNGANTIIDTDDDNVPREDFAQELKSNLNGRLVGNSEWVNVYHHFVDTTVWPRGLPLDEIHSVGHLLEDNSSHRCPIQQYLADRDPDVDAVYRLIFKNEVWFESKPAVILEKGVWCPFNSQNTVFHKEAFPLLYLPSLVSFRLTDILRSFVAQMGIWQIDGRLAFLSPTVEQYRNAHDLMRDYVDESNGYLYTKDTIKLLLDEAQHPSSDISKGLADFAKRMWCRLSADSVLVGREEKRIAEEWYGVLNSFENES